VLRRAGTVLVALASMAYVVGAAFAYVLPRF
jgi:hypothetical protein